ncbi:MAG: ABC transporter ATP-binding protein [Rhizobiaceae bacterium]|nr:MAG: ABC transporter ATP-binding protein [Rhizobiaceae bacterium]
MSGFLVVEGLTRSFGGVKAVDNVSFTLAKGELLALIGPNGAGKSTCFNMLYGVLRADSGSVKLEGQELIGLKPRQIWRLGVGRTFQITATFTSMTVVENVQMALISRARRAFGVLSSARNCYREEALTLLDLIGMRPQADRATNVLAYGDLKRLELAIALAHDPKLLLMDEPTAGMAQSERRALMQLTADLVRQRHTSVLFTEHDMDVVFEHAHRVLVLNRGRLLAEGSVEEIRANPEVRAVYLGGGATFEAAHA